MCIDKSTKKVNKLDVKIALDLEWNQNLGETRRNIEKEKNL